MIAYLYQGPKSQISKTADPVSLADCEDLFSEITSQGATVTKTDKTRFAQVGDMIAFAVIGDSQGDYYRAAKDAGLF